MRHHALKLEYSLFMKNSLIAALLNIARKAYHLMPLAPNRRMAIQGWFYKLFPVFFSRTQSFEIWQSKQASLNSLPKAKAYVESLIKQALMDNVSKIIIPTTKGIPTVSIIIPVYGQCEYTLLCLRSLANLATQISFEVIVVNDCSPDNTKQILNEVLGIQLINNATNLGFIRSCNLAAKAARGEFLVFLNNDTVVLEGWLDALINTFSSYPTAGLVGSKLLYPDGRLQEAGGIIWNDGTGMNFGRLDDPNKPEFNYVREVDYCSGASIAIKTKLFKQLGYFDERYIPAYFEDSDLAFAVRKAGFKVIYQPASQVVHYEGITSGTSLETGVKSYQLVNRFKFIEKWADALTQHGKPGASVFLERDRYKCGRILILDEVTPTPDQDSGSLDAYLVQKTLFELGYKVTFAPDNLHVLDRYTRQLQQIGTECLYEPYVPTLKHYLQRYGEAFDFVILNRAQAAHGNINNIKRYCPKAKVIFNTVDLQHLRQEREAALTGLAEIAKQAKRLREIEFELMHRCDMTIVISEVEAQLLHQQDPTLRLTVMPYMREVPGCHFSFAERKDIVFLGGFDHSPNSDAVEYFVKEIWPLVRAALPDVRFLIIGSKMTTQIKSMENHPGVVAVGYVEDLAEYFDYCKMTVVPLRFGAGIKGKIGTSASFGVPSVATTIAVEGMGFVDGEQILVADDPVAFAHAAVRLYQDEPLWNKLSQSCLAKINAQYSLEVGKKRLQALLAAVSDD
jgi:GT2 family glycosyltransferase/glycosyltransferase involved in cell wall biosynthesis